MTFTLIDETSGAPASDIEPFLGAPGHLVSVSADLSAAAHSHPVAQPGPASSVAFQLLFPRAGMQRVWVQFQRSGRVFTASFTIPVDERAARRHVVEAKSARRGARSHIQREPRGSRTAVRKR